MSSPVAAKRMTSDGSLSKAIERNEVEAVFHKDSYMARLKNIAKNKSDKGALEQAK